MTVWRRAVRGEPDAFEELVAVYDGRLLRACFVACGDPDLAAEAAQSAWCKAWRNLGRLRDESRFAGWLMVIGMNEARQLIRSQQRRRRYEGIVQLLHSQPRDSVLHADLDAALSRLSAEDHALLLMRYVEDLTSDEVGARLGLSAGAVRTRTRRLLQRLRKELGDGDA